MCQSKTALLNRVGDLPKYFCRWIICVKSHRVGDLPKPLSSGSAHVYLSLNNMCQSRWDRDLPKYICRWIMCQSYRVGDLPKLLSWGSAQIYGWRCDLLVVKKKNGWRYYPNIYGWRCGSLVVKVEICRCWAVELGIWFCRLLLRLMVLCLPKYIWMLLVVY